MRSETSFIAISTCGCEISGEPMRSFDNVTWQCALPERIFGVMTNAVLLAIPLFIFMGVMLEQSRIAEHPHGGEERSVRKLQQCQQNIAKNVLHPRAKELRIQFTEGAQNARRDERPHLVRDAAQVLRRRHQQHELGAGERLAAAVLEPRILEHDVRERVGDGPVEGGVRVEVDGRAAVVRLQVEHAHARERARRLGQRLGRRHLAGGGNAVPCLAGSGHGFSSRASSSSMTDVSSLVNSGSGAVSGLPGRTGTDSQRAGLA